MSTSTADTFSFIATQHNFETEVLQASLTQPVLVDFWAPWCAPCRSLGPILEKVIASYKGAVKLAKVDTDQEMQLAGAFGIRSLPTVVLIKNGQVVDGFMGALPESGVREFLTRHLPAVPDENQTAPEQFNPTKLSPEEALSQAQAAVAAEPDKAELKLELALALMRAGKTDEAANELVALPTNLSADARTKRLQAELEFTRVYKTAPPSAALRVRIDRDNNDFEARDLLGVRLLLEGEPAVGLDEFLYILRNKRDYAEGLAKQRLLAAFNMLEDEDLVAHYRRKMAAVVF